MKKSLLALLLGCSLLLGGCSWAGGSYHSVTPHREQSGNLRTENMTVSNYEELLAAMEAVTAKGTESCIINAVNYDPEVLEKNLTSAVRHIQRIYPIGAYAVESLNYEVGSNTGKTAIALNISYRHSPTEIRKVQKVRNLEGVQKQIAAALKDFDTVLVLQMEEYEQMDVAQFVQTYAMEHPRIVMETPQVTAEVYGIGKSRMLELTFSYQTSRDALRLMQTQVQPVFDSAVLYVSGEGAESQKFSQLYAFLMERFDYKVETSITPSYSLLRHGVGDSRAFATVYAAMCRASGLDCTVVTGTRSGEPWSWNMICEDGVYWHVDLLRCSESGGFQKCRDGELEGYVWDYSAYPACDQSNPAQEQTDSEEKGK